MVAARYRSTRQSRSSVPSSTSAPRTRQPQPGNLGSRGDLALLAAMIEARFLSSLAAV
jgi:hypothetical protein